MPSCRGVSTDPWAPLPNLTTAPKNGNTEIEDMAAAGLDASRHYETYGWHEGRNSDALFSTAYYLTARHV
jgi:hypothetical protein